MTSSAHQPFGTRSAYVSGKFPDRSSNPNPAPFNASSLSRHRTFGGANPGTSDFVADSGKAAQQPPPPPAHSQEPVNPLNRLTEEQREEINEAVRNFRLFFSLYSFFEAVRLLLFRPCHLFSPHLTRLLCNSSLCSI